jgi:hypothetical protein
MRAAGIVGWRRSATLRVAGEGPCFARRATQGDAARRTADDRRRVAVEECAARYEKGIPVATAAGSQAIPISAHQCESVVSTGSPSVRSVSSVVQIRFPTSRAGAPASRRPTTISENAGKRITVKPDFVFSRLKIAVFVDGCFFHGCPKHATWPKNNQGERALHALAFCGQNAGAGRRVHTVSRGGFGAPRSRATRRATAGRRGCCGRRAGGSSASGSMH